MVRISYGANSAPRDAAGTKRLTPAEERRRVALRRRWTASEMAERRDAAARMQRGLFSGLDAAAAHRAVLL